VCVRVVSGSALIIFVMVVKKKMISMKKHQKMILMYKVSDGSEDDEQ